MEVVIMKLKIIPENFSVCQMADYSKVNIEGNYCFMAKTDEEYSLVCPTGAVPENVLKREDGWRAFRIEGVLDFSLIGILSDISTRLADNRIGIFAVSTYNTDYIFTKEENFQRALDVLAKAGYEIC